MSQVQDAVDKIQRTVDEATRELSREDYIEVMDELADDFQVRSQTATEEMENEE